MTTDAIAGEHRRFGVAARTLGEAQRIAIEREAEYDLAWAKAMLDPDNTGKNKEQREAYCVIATWTERAQWDTARANVQVARAEVRATEPMVDVLERLVSVVMNGRD